MQVGWKKTSSSTLIVVWPMFYSVYLRSI
jgi:hypothetical protein